MAKVMAAVAQICSTPDIERNLRVCRELVEKAAGQGAGWVSLPENAPYLGPERSKPGLAETIDGPVAEAFASMAREFGVSILLGSTVEIAPTPERTYNTSILYNAAGERVSVYRKIHLFDVELPGGQSLRESDGVAPGEEVVLAELGGIKVGLTVCYDLRFPELYRALRVKEADVLCVPSAFTSRTGRDHWEVLLRARAIENQAYVVAPGQWGDHKVKGRHSYGRSMIIDPWGTVVAQVPDGEGVALAEIDTEAVAEVRRRMPCLNHARLLQ